MQNVNIRTLGDGIRLTCVTTNKWKTSLISACFALPLDSEGRSASALLPYALRSGCSCYPGRIEIAKRLDELYGARLEPFVAKRGEAQLIGIIADAVDESYTGGDTPLVQQTAQLVTDVLLNPIIPFPDEVLRNEAASLSAKIAALPNNKRAWAVRRLYQLMCDKEAYRFSEFGDIEGVEAVTPDTLVKTYRSVLRSAPLELFYCGSMQADEVAEIFRRELSAMTHRGSNIIKPEFYAPSDVSEIRYITEEENVSQGKLAIGLRTGITTYDELYPAMILFNACFGGTTSSRLFKTVREEKSLCYYASSSTDKLKGVMSVSSGIENENEQQARDEILQQLELIQDGDLSAEEIETARRSVLASMNTINDSPYALENFYQVQAAAGLDFTLDDLIERISAVTADQVTEAARRAKPDTVYFLKGAAK